MTSINNATDMEKKTNRLLCGEQLKRLDLSLFFILNFFK